MPITTTPSGGPQGEFSTYTPIYAQTLSSNTSSITFSNIPTTFTDLVLVCSARSAWTSDEYEAVGFRFNGDSSNNYSTTFVAGNGSSAASFRESTQPQITARMNPSTSSNTAFSSIIVQIQNYSNATTNKTVLIRSNSSVEFYEIAANVGTWRSTSPITSLFVGNARANLVAGSTFTLYGIKAAAAQFIPVNAAGGDYAVSDGTYAYHVFRSSGVFSPAKSLSCDILVVGGGGGGSTGGGGGGQFATFSSQSISTTSIITVGAGGAGGTDSTVGSNGGSSQFGALTASIGGGGGGTLAGSNGVSGASGGGGGTNDSTGFSGGSGTAGFEGGSGSMRNGGVGGGGGGGGAGAGGSNAGVGNAGAGGVGTYSSLSNALSGPTNTGQLSGGNYYYAGGGGGGANTSTQAGGGLGGGGTGFKASPASGGSSGTANTGGGGGATWNQGSIFHGGSGIVIVRYTL